MMTTGPVAFASAGVVCAEAEALELEDPEQPVSASAPQETSRVETARTRMGAFHRRFLQESRGFVEPGWGQTGCWISVRLCVGRLEVGTGAGPQGGG